MPTCTNLYNCFSVELYSLQIISFLVGLVSLQLPENPGGLSWLFLFFHRGSTLLLPRHIASSREGRPGCRLLLLGAIVGLKGVHEVVIEEVLKAREESWLILVGRPVLGIIRLWWKSLRLHVERVWGRWRVVIAEAQAEGSDAEVHLNLINIIVIQKLIRSEYKGQGAESLSKRRRFNNINNFKQRMGEFQEDLHELFACIFRTSELHAELFEMANQKIISREQLSQNAYIKDELMLARKQLDALKAETEEKSAVLKQKIEKYASKLERVGREEALLLVLAVNRALEIIQNSVYEVDNEYYSFYNSKFRLKCQRIIAAIESWEVFEIFKVLYKYFRHIVLIEIERNQEILEFLGQMDFDNLRHFKDRFYHILKEKEANSHENKMGQQNLQNKEKDEKQHHPTGSLLQTQNQPIVQPQRNEENVPSKIQVQKPEENKRKNPHHYLTSVVQDAQVNQNSKQRSKPPRKQSQSKQILRKKEVSSEHQAGKKEEKKISKKLYSILSSVMDIKKDTFPKQIENKDWQSHSVYSELFVRNKLNYTQIEKYFSYSQTIKDQMKQVDTKDFYFYQEQTMLQSVEFPQKSATDKKLQKKTKVIIPLRDRISLFGSAELTKKEPLLLSNNLQKRRQNKTIHKTINCRPRADYQNMELLEQKQTKIDSEFLEINLRKIIPNKRQSQFDQMVSRATSLGFLKHDLHTQRISIVNQNLSRISPSQVFKSVKILHHNEFNPNKQRDVREKQRELRQKGRDQGHPKKIESKIKEQLRGGENMEQKMKKAWKESISLRRIDH